MKLFIVLQVIHSYPKYLHSAGKVTEKREKSERKVDFSFLFRVQVTSAIAKVIKKVNLSCERLTLFI